MLINTVYRYSLINKNIRKIRKALFIILLVLIVILIYLNLKFLFKPQQVKIQDISPDKLELYFRAQKQFEVDWYYFDILERQGEYVFDDWEQVREIAREIKSGKISQISDESEYLKYDYINSIIQDKVFPIKKGQDYEYTNDWNTSRTFGGDRKHEGIDIICEKGTPVVSVCDGKVQKKGWNTLGGWRLGIVDENRIYYYYAHLDRYAKDIQVGSYIKKGQIIGYVGDTGYGPEGTSGKFIPHLHFGMYESIEYAVSPYPFLKLWEYEQ